MTEEYRKASLIRKMLRKQIKLNAWLHRNEPIPDANLEFDILEGKKIPQYHLDTEGSLFTLYTLNPAYCTCEE